MAQHTAVTVNRSRAQDRIRELVEGRGGHPLCNGCLTRLVGEHDRIVEDSVRRLEGDPHFVRSHGTCGLCARDRLVLSLRSANSSPDPSPKPEPSEQDLTGKIRKKLAEGRLPRESPTRLWVGNGNGNVCDACGQPIAPADLEYEPDFVDRRRTVRLHQACLDLWHQERVR